jgi:neutral ceramidase
VRGEGLVAGAASLVVTPQRPLPMAGFADRTGASQGVVDDLFVRALVVQDGAHASAVVVADVIGLERETVTTAQVEIAARTGIPARHVIVAATHTHSGPAVMPHMAGGPVDSAYYEEFSRALVATTVAACEHARPAMLRLGIGYEATVAKNRRVVGGLIDTDLPLIEVVALSGEPIALVASYACHPVVLGPHNRAFSADYPGVLRSTLERLYPGTLALFLTGCAGQINTGHRASDSLATKTHWDPLRSYEECERVGRLLAVAAAGARERAHPPGGRPLAGTDADSAVAVASRPVSLSYYGFDCSSWTGEVTAFRWGSIALIGLPGEPFAEIGLVIKQLAGVAGVMVCGYSNGCPGYVPWADAYAVGGYEVEEAHLYYGAPACFAPEASGTLVEAALGALDDVTENEALMSGGARR